MIGRLTNRLLGALIGLAFSPVAWWEQWATDHDSEPWEDDD